MYTEQDRKHQRNYYRKHRKRIREEKLRSYYKNHELNKKKNLEGAKKRQTKNRLYVQEHLKDHFCVDCNESDPIVLEFDHVRGKKSMGIASMVSQGVSFERLVEEIKKCDVRCANCHRRKTAKERGYV